MSSLIAALAFLVAPADGAAVKELAAATQKVVDAQSYSFEYLPAANNAPAPKPAADGAAKKGEADDAGEKEPAAWKVEIQKRSPWHYQRGEVDMFRHELTFALKNKEGKWIKVGTVPMQRRGPGAGAGPGATAGGAPPKAEPTGGDDGDDDKDGKKPEAGEKGGRRDRRGPQRLASAAEQVPLVHQIFYDFETRVSDVTKEAPAADGAVVYVATLTPAAARELTNEGRALRMGEGRPGHEGGGDGKEAHAGAAEHAGEASATLRVAVKDGAVTSVVIEAASKTPGGERKSGGRITLSNVNATKIVVPPEAQALFTPPPAKDGAPEKK